LVAALLALLQCGLAGVLAYRLYILTHTYKSSDPRRRAPATFLKVQRACIFLMTILQSIRCIDPFCTYAILPYSLVRFLQLAVTITLYFSYSCTTYVVMDTLHACALKRTPAWLAIVVCILPVAEFAVGFGCLAAEYVIAQQWITAITGFFVVLVLAVNLVTYNVSGMTLIFILRKHQQTGTAAIGEDISGSKSASPFDIVIAKTIRSMFFLTLPSLATLLMFFVSAVGNCNTRPMPVYNPNAVTWGVLATLFVQLVIGLMFTRITWVSKTALGAEIVAKTVTKTVTSEGSSPSPETKARRSSRAPSRAELKDKALRISQSPKPRASEGLSSQSRPEVELQEVETAQSPAVTVAVTDVPNAVSKSDNSLLVPNEADLCKLVPDEADLCKLDIV